MGDIAIKIENLSKCYHIGTKHGSARYRTIRDALISVVQVPFKRARALLKNKRYPARETNNTIWALKGVSLDIKRGEVVGIIGPNGAGKTTLLKILSRITEPAEGQVEIYGRVGSLLEVGTGFHPELTGRENILLNGAILGMKKREILKKFDEIVAFAEIEKFIDTTVKFYSSGMYMRLAFAVAAHLEPEILLIDEVLAVGDIAFQKKCLGKMNEVAKGGRTVIFVSHNMGAVQQLCSRAILLNGGVMIMSGSAASAVNHYLTMGIKLYAERSWPDIDEAPGDNAARMRAVRVLDQYGGVCTDFDVRDPVFIEIEYWVLRNVSWLDVSFYFYNQMGDLIFISVDNTADLSTGDRPRPAGLYRSVCHIPADFLNNGQIYVQAALTNETENHTIQPSVVMFNVTDTMDPSGARGNYRDEWPPSAVRPRLQWTTECLEKVSNG